MKKYIVMLAVCWVAVFTPVACNTTSTKNTEDEPGMDKNQNNTTEVSGGTVDNTYDAPTEIKSKNIEAFKTHFYLWNQFDEAAEGSYSFTIEKNDSGEYVLSEDNHIRMERYLHRVIFRAERMLSSVLKCKAENRLMLTIQVKRRKN